MELDAVTDALGRVVGALADGGESRPGQVTMAEAVAQHISSGRHLLVQAGTGTGKTFAYLVPALLSGRKVVVATATKALQDQLAKKDLPLVVDHLDSQPEWAVLKGRSNYACRQRLVELAGGGGGQLELADESPMRRDEIRRLAAWAAQADTGDRAELSWEPAPAAWAAISVGADECPGASRCPQGESCFAEQARRRAAEADVVVVNMHLYGLDLASGGALLPDHDVVVLDEAHQLEDIISDTAGTGIGAGRFTALSRTVRAVISDDALAHSLATTGDTLVAVLKPHVGQRIDREPPTDVRDVLTLARSRIEAAMQALRAVPDNASEDVKARALRATKAATTLIGDVDRAMSVPDGYVAWVEGPTATPVLAIAPIDVRELLATELWARRRAILTSATLPTTLPVRLGLPTDSFDVLDVGSPFDYAQHAVLYCAAHLPDPRRPGYEAAVHDELAALITAAGGRTLALFTSWRAMTAAAQATARRVPYRILTQAEMPKPALLAAFGASEEACLFATMGFWQGIDVPGPTLTLVTIDRLPFARPDDPLVQARREKAGANAFAEIDVPRAGMLLAQAAGRLIRTATDRGVVAVFDSRLASASYRWDLVRALPPMRRTRDRGEVERFLRSLAA